MKTKSTKSSYWELLLGIAIIAFQLCAWPTAPRLAKSPAQPVNDSVRPNSAGTERAKAGWLESTTASEKFSVSDSNLKTS